MFAARLSCLLALALASAVNAADQPFWEEAQATVDPRGDLAWAPRPFVFTAGASRRYIDFAGGDDSRDGTTPATAWKHHPWDANATGVAAAGSGVHTYLFKGGVTYRGTLVADGSGTADEPIRLTRDPAWGDGPATLCGSERVQGWTLGADHADIPEADRVWWADVPFAPRTLWRVANDGTAVRIPLARTPNWTFSNPDDLKEGWWSWDNPGKPFGNTAEGRHLGIDTVHIRDKPASYFQDAVIWPEFGWVMGGPYPTQVEGVDLAQHALRFSGWTGPGTSGVIFRGMRYYLEDKPQYLDDPAGEFWVDRRDRGSRIFLRLPDDMDPNAQRIEAGARGDLILARDSSHLAISGLDFRFTTPTWDLTTVMWDFSTKPWGYREDAHPACIRIWGAGSDLSITHCTFGEVVMPIQMRSLDAKRPLGPVLIADNDIARCDEGGVNLSGGAGWGFAQADGRLGDVRILRNRIADVGMRPSRYGLGTAINVGAARTLEIAGNSIARCGAQGINVVGGKSSGMWGDIPFSRTLIHHNKVWMSMQYCNDYGGIEAWQGGPTYIYNNLSYDARGLWYGRQKVNGSSPGFGHAYYLDGAYKSYLFNNIAWGRSNDPTSILVNCSAFQEIHGYLNTYAHNTAYRYTVGSRRQAPEAGLNQYLGNVFVDISERVFRHSDPAKTAAEGNAADAGKQKAHFDVATNAYAGNVFAQVAEFGVFEPSGRWLKTLDDYRRALAGAKAQASGLGQVAAASPLADPANGDFRPKADSAAVGAGCRIFIPWALSGVVGEWHFVPRGDDPTVVPDLHWYFADYYLDREHYHERPRFPLHFAGTTSAAYQASPLQDWAPGALDLKGRSGVVAHTEMTRRFSFEGRRLSRHEGAKPEAITIPGDEVVSPAISTQNLLIEAHVRIAKGSSGTLVAKLDGNGYAVRVTADGRLRFDLSTTTGSASLPSTSIVAEGTWRHVVVEADRASGRMTLYLDGTADAESTGPLGGSLASAADLTVGDGTLDATLAFLRIARGTLADAGTTIDELHAWEFEGPHLRDFSGRKPTGARRSAGALEPAP